MPTVEEQRHLFISDRFSLLDSVSIPKHIAIIMDGNRRWARNKGLIPMMGHWEGAEVLMEIVRAASLIGVQTLTVYCFSTENWGRPEEEVEALIQLFELYLVKKRELMVREGVCLNAIGDLSKFPPKLLRILDESKEATASCDKINLVLALNYGGRDDLRRAFQKIVKNFEGKVLRPEDITEKAIAASLDTFPWGDPQLLIRTSGEVRVSNFLLWQISYSEIYVTEKLWPEFSPDDLLEAVLAYQRRIRRIGI
jgi:undecaprenyl diphosphate synthase